MHANISSIIDKTPTFAENLDFMNIELCLNGISDFLLYSTTLNLNQSNHITNYFLEDKKDTLMFSNVVNNIEFEELIRLYRLHRYYNKINQQNNIVLLETQNYKTLSNNHQTQPQICIKIIGNSPSRINNKKYAQIESRYSPKNLKFYLKQEQQCSDIRMMSTSRHLTQSIRQSRSSSLNMSSINSNQKSQNFNQIQKKQNGPKNYQFCLLSQKHQELTKLKQQYEQSKTINLSYTPLSQRIEKNK
ncbi:unnamed protein product [Paramecium sonneborni]|uniref:Uncharacterized protein n=1 Tax=Paramecium sonneborni TaxID=65129 RepID=A0A8S1L4M0_9CILI|nr:unnamed protein product [Paramecium sonneborni]